MRKALIIGVDFYEHFDCLSGCVNDAYAVKQLLERNGNGSVNFGQPLLLVATSTSSAIKRVQIKDAVRELFDDDSDVALFYFAGHGYIESSGGYICGSDCETGDDGLPLAEIMTMANSSRARNKIIILDSCHGGKIAEHAFVSTSEIAEGVTILTASRKDQAASEDGSGGVFTTLLVDALSGAAANLIGLITPGSVYAHIDQSLGNWRPRPVFKTNIVRFVSLREVQPPIPPADLRRIADFFPSPGFEFQLDPSYEPRHPDAKPEHTAVFSILQKYNRVNLLVPIDAEHMYDAAIESKSAKLTGTGEHYRRLVSENLI